MFHIKGFINAPESGVQCGTVRLSHRYSVHSEIQTNSRTVRVDIDSFTHIDTFVLQRYDGDVYLEEVDADFVVWEIHGRHDYSYTATAKKVCSVQRPIIV